jgi:glycosyltransferase involved in cell wall biosynthesis
MLDKTQFNESALAETYRHAEVIVIDDRSTDDWREITSGFGSRMIAIRKVNGDQLSPSNRFRRN